MGFDTRGSMPVTCPFTCSKKRYQRFSLRADRPAQTKHTSFRLNCKVYGSVFCFLSPFSPVLLVVAVNAIRNPIVFRAKIGQTPPLRENRYPEH